MNVSDEYPQADNENAYMSFVISFNIIEVFFSGSQDSRDTVAEAFDIEYRSFFIAKSSESNSSRSSESEPGRNFDQGRKRIQDTFQTYKSLILDDKIDLMKDLVVDMRLDKIGFRNHTIPLDSEKDRE